jgi:hypothetical protein
VTTTAAETPNRLRDPDGFYQALLALHEGLDVEQSLAVNARLILLMAQTIGDDAILHELLQQAHRSVR